LPRHVLVWLKLWDCGHSLISTHQTTLMLMTSEVLDFTESIRGLMTTLFTAWGDRHKQIVKKWRALPSERKAPFLQQARENRAALRMKKTQQVSLEMYVFTCMCKCVNPLYVTGSVSITGVCTFYLMLMG
jgi:hypothetical protein